LLDLAAARQPDVIICVDYAGFNRRFASAIRKRTRNRGKWFHDWRPLIVQYVSPQVWASRESRVYQIARDYDLILSTFGFEQAWYERRVPGLRVEFVGNPIIDRYGLLPINETPKDVRNDPAREPDLVDDKLSVLLLPGSRKAEVERHLPVMMNALTMMRTVFPNLRARMVLPDNEMLARVQADRRLENVSPQAGGLGEALRETTIAIAKTGTIALECAYFGVPTVAIYRTSWIEYQIGKLIVTVRYAAMPNLLADKEIFPEFIAFMATPGNIARAALDLLRNPQRRRDIKTQLRAVVASLGTPGASQRAADAILRLDPKLLF
jgi:lipid-A-disaccharide synthase